jgi:deoxyribodipyrimidine photo-lyase
MKSEVSIFWFRRDLRLHDNAGLFHALKESKNIIPIFIFDTNILNKLSSSKDKRVNFIYQTLFKIKSELVSLNSDLIILSGTPLESFKKLTKKYEIKSVYTNNDYEPYAVKRDLEVENYLKKIGISFQSYKDQVLFEKDEVLNSQNKPYTVFTAYKNKIIHNLNTQIIKEFNCKIYLRNLLKIKKPSVMIDIKSLGFKYIEFKFPSAEVDIASIKAYEKNRNFPYLKHGTSNLGLHLRFGTISVRKLARIAQLYSSTWLSELIWRDFYKQILWHYPEVLNSSFRKQYNNIKWRNSKTDFNKWKSGLTGYPLVDAGMRELVATGNMHNRVRMIVASFLTKHLLIHWSKGEKYFASLLLDYDLSSNNGNWQWAAGCGCDAAPYFRIFNPLTQAKKFDPNDEYIKKWVPEFNTSMYPKPMVNHNFARQRCFKVYSEGLNKK